MKTRSRTESPTNSSVAVKRAEGKLFAKDLPEKRIRRETIDYLDAAVPILPLTHKNKEGKKGYTFLRTLLLVDNSVKLNETTLTPESLNKIFANALEWTPETIRRAGVMLQKHGDRNDEYFSPIKGKVKDKEKQAVNLANEIMGKRTTIRLYSMKKRFEGYTLDFIGMDGRGVRYNPKGFKTFLGFPQEVRDILLGHLSPERQT